jgi:hypothetical protein
MRIFILCLAIGCRPPVIGHSMPLPLPAASDPRGWWLERRLLEASGSGLAAQVDLARSCELGSCIPVVRINIERREGGLLYHESDPLASIERRSPPYGLLVLRLWSDARPTRGAFGLGETLGYDVPISWFVRFGEPTECESKNAIRQAEAFGATILEGGFDVQLQIEIDGRLALLSEAVRVPIVLCPEDS